jgi:hypothetical protein
MMTEIPPGSVLGAGACAGFLVDVFFWRLALGRGRVYERQPGATVAVGAGAPERLFMFR